MDSLCNIGASGMVEEGSPSDNQASGRAAAVAGISAAAGISGMDSPEK